MKDLGVTPSILPAVALPLFITDHDSYTSPIMDGPESNYANSKLQYGDYVFLNGRITPAAEAAIPVRDRGFAYGDALVETVKLSGGKPVFFAEHYQRLARACAATGISPVPERGELWRTSVALAAANRVGDGRLRLQLSRGIALQPEGLDPGPLHEPTLLITAQPFAGYPERFYREGMSCATVAADRGAWAHLKTASLITTIMARRQAMAAGADEALFATSHGSLLEGSYTNLFFIVGGECRTAAEAERILPGVMRAKVLRVFAEIAIPVKEKALKGRELESGASAFLTSSLLGFCPVRRIDTLELRLDLQFAVRISNAVRQQEEASISRTFG